MSLADEPKCAKVEFPRGPSEEVFFGNGHPSDTEGDERSNTDTDDDGSDYDGSDTWQCDSDDVNSSNTRLGVSIKSCVGPETVTVTVDLNPSTCVRDLLQAVDESLLASGDVAACLTTRIVHIETGGILHWLCPLQDAGLFLDDSGGLSWCSTNSSITACSLYELRLASASPREIVNQHMASSTNDYSDVGRFIAATLTSTTTFGKNKPALLSPVQDAALRYYDSTSPTDESLIRASNPTNCADVPSQTACGSSCACERHKQSHTSKQTKPDSKQKPGTFLDEAELTSPFNWSTIFKPHNKKQRNSAGVIDKGVNEQLLLHPESRRLATTYKCDCRSVSCAERIRSWFNQQNAASAQYMFEESIAHARDEFLQVHECEGASTRNFRCMAVASKIRTMNEGPLAEFKAQSSKTVCKRFRLCRKIIPRD